MFAKADLSGAYLEEANLSGAILSDADLEGANLTDADLEGAMLFRADLKSANLSGANLDYANLSGADFQGADLKGVEKLTQNQLNEACAASAYNLPEGLVAPPPCKRDERGLIRDEDGNPIRLSAEEAGTTADTPIEEAE